MSFDSGQSARQVYQLIAGHTILSLSTCMTRLRITLANNTHLPLEQLKAVDGVLGVITASDQLQIVFGPGRVNQVYEQFKLVLDSSAVAEDLINSAANNPPVKPLDFKAQSPKLSPFKLFLKRLANTFVPLIPAFIGCGLILGLLNVLSKTLSPEFFGGVPLDQTTLGALLKVIGSSITFGLALFTGINACKEFGGTPIYGGVLAAVLTMPELAQVKVFGVAAIPGRGGIIAVLLVAIFAAYLELDFGSLDLVKPPINSYLSILPIFA